MVTSGLEGSGPRLQVTGCLGRPVGGETVELLLASHILQHQLWAGMFRIELIVIVNTGCHWTVNVSLPGSVSTFN